jgi:hypothetical protein
VFLKKLRFENVENLRFQIIGKIMLFWKRAILKGKLQFCQTLNYVFKNHVFKSFIWKSLFLKSPFWNHKPKQILNNVGKKYLFGLKNLQLYQIGP